MDDLFNILSANSEQGRGNNGETRAKTTAENLTFAFNANDTPLELHRIPTLHPAAAPTFEFKSAPTTDTHPLELMIQNTHGNL